MNQFLCFRASTYNITIMYQSHLSLVFHPHPHPCHSCTNLNQKHNDQRHCYSEGELTHNEEALALAALRLPEPEAPSRPSLRRRRRDRRRRQLRRRRRRRRRESATRLLVVPGLLAVDVGHRVREP